MKNNLQTEGKFSYLEKGEGTPIVILHGLMGGLSNFDGVVDYFPDKGYKILIPELPLYNMSLLQTSVQTFAKFIRDFIKFQNMGKVILLGNSLGGHIALLATNMYSELIKGLVITGSSGLYENAMGESYPRRGVYEFIKKKALNVFYDPAVATKEIRSEEHTSELQSRENLVCRLLLEKKK